MRNWEGEEKRVVVTMVEEGVKRVVNRRMR
jgi:hypothetical protein